MRALEYVYVVGNGHASEDRQIDDAGSAHRFAPHLIIAHARHLLRRRDERGEGGAIERAAHALLRPFRLNSEWFSSTPEAAIGAVQEAARSLGVAIIAVMPFELNRAPRRSMLILAS